MPRSLLLRQYGGIWLDTDDVLLRDLRYMVALPSPIMLRGILLHDINIDLARSRCYWHQLGISRI